MSGVISLTASTVVVKIIGLVYKIPMLSLVGGEGMGYFNSAYEIYALLCIMSITGLPVAMSVIISQSGSRKRAKGVFSLSLTLFTVIGIAAAMMLALLSGVISGYLKSEKAYLAILAIAPSLAFVCMGSAYKGYFQGLTDMKPICVSGIIEAVSKLVFGLFLAWLGKHAGLPNYAVAAMGVLSISIGSLISLIYFVFYKKRLDRKDGVAGGRATFSGGERRRILIDIVKISFPATLSSLMISLTRVVDMVMILRRLQDIGYTSEGANELYGGYTTMAIPIFSLAAALISAITVPLIPELARSIGEGNIAGQGEKISCAMRLTSYISCPMMLGISLYSKEILSLIFSSQASAVNKTAPLLSLLGLSVLTSVMISLTNSMLQAYRQAAKPIISMAVGCGIKIVISFFLIGNARINILGAPIGTFFCDLVICIINFVYLFKYFRGKVSFWSTVAMPAVCAASAIIPMFFGMRAAQYFFGESRIVTLACIAAAGLIYLIFAGKRIKNDLGV